MSEYYGARKTRNLYTPDSEGSFRLSRSKIDLFLNCPMCFYLDRRMGVQRPPGFPFALNSAVDTLLKKEFDIHRSKSTTHPLMQSYGLKDIVPFAHEDLDIWRENFKGVSYYDKDTNFTITGAIDDVWINTKTEELIIVDYKSTSKEEKVTLDKEWQIGYKRQMEIYQWLFKQNGYKVSSTGYFVYCNGKTDREAFDAKLEFDIDLIAYEGDTSWIPGALKNAKKCLDDDKVPKPDKNCDYCNYRKIARDAQTSWGK